MAQYSFKVKYDGESRLVIYEPECENVTCGTLRIYLESLYGIANSKVMKLIKGKYFPSFLFWLKSEVVSLFFSLQSFFRHLFCQLYSFTSFIFLTSEYLTSTGNRILTGQFRANYSKKCQKCSTLDLNLKFLMRQIQVKHISFILFMSFLSICLIQR